MKKILFALSVIAAPAHAATGPFFSLRNTDFIVTLAFLTFIGILVYFKVPQLVGRLLDQRAEGIRADLEESRKLREEAQEIYASFERQSREVSSQADEIVANAKRESAAFAEKSKADLEISIARRLKAAEEQIAAAEQDAVRAVRNQAVQVGVAVASEILAKQKGEADRSSELDRAIDEVAQRLH